MRSSRRTAVKASPFQSSRAHREAALEARIAELEAELRSRDDFLAIAAHELRNPMTPISTRVELLLAKARRMRGVVPKEIVQGLERLERSLDAYLRRATLLLKVSRINSGNLRLHMIAVDLSALVRKVTMRMIPAAERAGCQVRLTVHGGSSSAVMRPRRRRSWRISCLTPFDMVPGDL
jgi:signal transduction histidine kinase